MDSASRNKLVGESVMVVPSMMNCALAREPRRGSLNQGFADASAKARTVSIGNRLRARL